MKQKAFVWMGIVPIAILLTLMAMPAYAATFDMELKLFQNISTCPTILQDTPPLSKNDIPVFITNLHEYPDTFQLSLKLPSGWSGFVDPDFFVDSNQRKQVDSLWITVPDVDPGFYPVEIKAVSGRTGEAITKKFGVEVLSCHSVLININEEYQEVCREEVDKAVFKVEITNTGKDAETFDLSVLKGGKVVDYASLSMNSVTLSSGDTKEVEVFLEIPEGMEGLHEFALKARSETSYVTVVKSFKLRVNDCYDFNVLLRPAESEACLGEKADYTLKIDNLGLSDTFRITGSDWVALDTGEVDIAEKGSKEIGLEVGPEVKGKTPFIVEVQSAADPLNRKEAKGHVTVEECRNLAVIVSPSATAVCSGEKVELEVVVKNTGSVEEEVGLTADLGVLEKDRILLNPKEAKSVKLTVDTSEFTGKKPVTVIAEMDKITDRAVAEINSENCYKAELTVEPESVDVCPCGEAEFRVTLKNMGKLEDSYTVLFDEVTQTVKLDPDEGKVFKYTVPVSCDMSGSHTIDVSAKSKFFSYTDSAELNVKDAENCYAVVMSGEKQIEVEVSKAVAEVIRVKNEGEIKDSFTFSVEGPVWIYLEPSSLELEGGEEKAVYIYVSPPLGTAESTYPVKVTAKSDRSEAAFDVDILVKGEGAGVPTGEVTKPSGNLSIGPDQGVKLNASLGENESVGEEEPQPGIGTEAWKPIAIGIITIIIIMILIVRFVTLSK